MTLPLTIAELTIDVPGVPSNVPILWENRDGSGKRVNAHRTLTHHSPTREGGLAMDATRPFTDLPAHIQRNIDRHDSGCWLWKRSRDRDGYGWATLHNKTHHAHRLVYRLLVGDPPSGLVLDHLCRVRHCVNPRHLQPVTNRDNLLRSPLTEAGRANCLRCGGPFSRIGRAKAQRCCLRCRHEYAKNYRAQRRGLPS